MGIGLMSSSKDSLASLSACSLPGMPMWLGIQQRTTIFFLRWTSLYFNRNSSINEFDKSSFSIDCRQDNESVKIMNLFRSESLTIFKASINATASAEKVLAPSGILVCNSPKSHVAARLLFHPFWTHQCRYVCDPYRVHTLVWSQRGMLWDWYLL